MANLKDIRSRIQSTKNTQQITRAMKMVSAAKLRRAQHHVVAMRPYAGKILKMIQAIANSHRVQHPLLDATPHPERVMMVVLTSDRGLCGAFNNSVNRFAYEYYLENKSRYEAMDFFFVGRKGADFFKKRKVEGKETILALDKNISYAFAGNLAEKLMSWYVEGDYDEIRIIYNEFKSALQQNVVAETLLPVRLGSETSEEQMSDMMFEPNPSEIIDQLLHKHFAVQVYRCMSESVASEHGSRMTAMENATKNAQEMIRGLTLTYNKLRQASITTELTEITSGAEALKS